MRLAFVNSAWPASWGGGEKWTVDAAEWFQTHGHDVWVIGRPVSKLLAAARGRGLNAQEFPFGGDFNPLVVRKARRLLALHGVGLVVVNFNKEAWQFGRAAKSLGLPVVARHGFPLFRRRLHHRRLFQQYITRLVVNARSIRDDYALLGFDMSHTYVFHNGVRILPQRDGELRRRFGIPTDAPLILAAGRVESQKRFDHVLDIASQLIPQYPTLRVLIAGEGPDRDVLEQQLASRHLTDSIRFTGFIPDLAEIIGDADVFLLTSDQEGTPNVLLEAMAAGVASLAFGIGSVPEIMTGDLASNCLPPGDVARMTRRLDKLLKDAAARRAIGAAMRKHIEAEFSVDLSMRQFERLFQTTLAVNS